MQKLTTNPLKVSDLGSTSLYKQGDIFTETLLFYTYSTLLKITTTTGKSSFLLISGRADPASRRVASADRVALSADPWGGAERCPQPLEESPPLGVRQEHTLRSRLAWLKL